VDAFSKDDLIAFLQFGDLELQGQFVLGSNDTLLVRVDAGAQKLTAVYKPVRGERPLWDFPYGTLEKREAAAWLVSEALGWDLVPPVVYREDAPFGPGSIQLFIEHDPNYHYFTFSKEDVQRLRPAVIFDLLINNADRKGGHFLKDGSGHIWLIDHGLCFHEDDKYRSVVWDFAGEEFGENLLGDLRCFLNNLEDDRVLSSGLERLLTEDEIFALLTRGAYLHEYPAFPLPDEHQRQFPWPPV
jgi:uncharacterized repeat protein (TIGR03843 family)